MAVMPCVRGNCEESTPLYLRVIFSVCTLKHPQAWERALCEKLSIPTASGCILLQGDSCLSFSLDLLFRVKPKTSEDFISAVTQNPHSFPMSTRSYRIKQALTSRK